MQGWLKICKSVKVMHNINKVRDKNHVIILIDTEKIFDKMQHPFMIRTFNKLSIAGMYLNIIKANMTSPQLTSYSLVKAEHF